MWLFVQSLLVLQNIARTFDYSSPSEYAETYASRPV